MRMTGYVVLVILSLTIAAYAFVSYGLLPFDAVVDPLLSVTFKAHTFALYSHVFAAAIALSLGAFQFSSRLRAKRLELHRWMGRVYLSVGVLIGGISGLFMALHAFGGVTAQLGFACLAVAWLYTGARAYAAIRTGDIVSHRRWMIRNFSLTFAAVTLRLYIPVSVAAGAAFEDAYPIIAWVAWVPNLIVAEWLFNRRRGSAVTEPEPKNMSKTRPASAA